MNHVFSKEAPKRQQNPGARNLQHVCALTRCAAIDIEFNAKGA